jgi:replicative DNA helicase
MTARDEFDMPEDPALAMLRVPPHNNQAESNVLGGLLLDSGIAWDRVGDVLKDSDFYRHEHRLVFAAIRDLCNANKPADVTTVLEQLERQGKAEEVGGIGYLGRLANEVPNAANVRRYAEIVRERALLRGLVTASDEIATLAFSPEGKTVDEVVDAAQAKVFAIAESRVAAHDDWQGAEAGMVELIDSINAQAEGTAEPDYTPTGLHDLDERLNGGLRGGELIVLAARPRMGKTALALCIADHIAGLRKPAGFFSMEMPKQQVYKRQLSLRSHIHLSRLKRAERLRDYDWPAITESVENIRRVPFFVTDTGNLNINQIRARARGLARRQGQLGVLVVDYLGLMSGTDPKQQRAYQIEEATKGLKTLAKELNVPVLLLAQVNRKVEERVDQMPMLSDLRDSGSIEQDADIVLFVHREFVAKAGLADEWKYHAKVAVAKVRDGEPGQLDLMYVGENTRFMNWPKETELPSSLVRTGGKASKGGDL